MTLNCEINFDQNVNGVYYAGQLVSGSAIINVSKKKKVRAICLRITGAAMCQWIENELTGNSKNPSHHSVSYLGNEEYFTTSTYLVPGGAPGDGFDLKPGSHRYTFACALPAMLPTSFEGTYGHIRYTIKVVLERPWKFDHTYQVAFTILKDLNLNLMAPQLRIPAQMEFSKSFYCGPCRSQPLSISASVPQTGYVAGQVISISANLDNASNTIVSSLHFELVKIIKYHSQVPKLRTKDERKIVTKHKDVGVAKRGNGTFLVHLTVPPVPATSNDGSSSIIHIKYAVVVTAKVSGVHESPLVEIPITIGTVPLTLNTMSPVYNKHIETGPIFEQPVAGQMIPSAPVILTPNPNEMTGHPLMKGVGGAATFEIPNLEIAPPSYEESISGGCQIIDVADSHAIPSHSYTPRYPVFNFQQHEASIQRPGLQPGNPIQIQKY